MLLSYEKTIEMCWFMIASQYNVNRISKLNEESKWAIWFLIYLLALDWHWFVYWHWILAPFYTDLQKLTDKQNDKLHYVVICACLFALLCDRVLCLVASFNLVYDLLQWAGVESKKYSLHIWLSVSDVNWTKPKKALTWRKEVGDTWNCRITEW